MDIPTIMSFPLAPNNRIAPPLGSARLGAAAAVRDGLVARADEVLVAAGRDGLDAAKAAQEAAAAAREGLEAAKAAQEVAEDRVKAVLTDMVVRAMYGNTFVSAEEFGREHELACPNQKAWVVAVMKRNMAEMKTFHDPS